MIHPKNALILALALPLLQSCSKGSNSPAGQTGADEKPVPSLVPAEAYFSAENPGKWKERAHEHEILIREGKIRSSGKTRLRELIVTVPLAGDAQHYLEAGLVMDHSLKKELDKVAFKPGTPKYDLICRKLLPTMGSINPALSRVKPVFRGTKRPIM